MTKRTFLLALAAVAACGAVAIVVLSSHDATRPSAAAAAPRVDSPRNGTQPATTPTLAAAQPFVHADGEAIEDTSEYPVDPAPPTREEPLTAEQRDPRQKRAIEMLDQAVVRAEARLAAAEAAGDTAAATTARVRIKRLKEVREKRVNDVGATP